jgi:hypothetical protein
MRMKIGEESESKGGKKGRKEVEEETRKWMSPPKVCFGMGKVKRCQPGSM